MNRSEAKMIAEELHKFIRNDVRKVVTEMATAETEEYLNAKQAAVFLGWKLQTLYNRIHDIPHTKMARVSFYQISFDKIHGKKIIPDGFDRLSGN